MTTRPRTANLEQESTFDEGVGELSVEETGQALHVSPQTVMRDWKLARAWLARELT